MEQLEFKIISLLVKLFNFSILIIILFMNLSILVMRLSFTPTF